MSSEAEDTPTSLKALWAQVQQQRKHLAGFNQDFNSAPYQSAVAQALATITACKNAISSLSLFSSNEFLEDVATTEIQCVHTHNKTKNTPAIYAYSSISVFICRQRLRKGIL